MCVYIYTHTHKYTHIHIYVRANIDIHIYRHTHTYINTSMAYVYHLINGTRMEVKATYLKEQLIHKSLELCFLP